MAIKLESHIFKVWIVTLSDRASQGQYEDLSGPEAVRMLNGFFESMKWKCQIYTRIIPDSAPLLNQLLDEALTEGADLFITSGGTGIGPRDITPETLRPRLDRELPGIMEFIRIKYGSEKPAALLSRAVAGVTGTTLVYTLPGSPKAVKEYLTEILKTLAHTFYMLHGIDRHG